jgi:hypothetical protein
MCARHGTRAGSATSTAASPLACRTDPTPTAGAKRIFSDTTDKAVDIPAAHRHPVHGPAPSAAGARPARHAGSPRTGPRARRHVRSDGQGRQKIAGDAEDYRDGDHRHGDRDRPHYRPDSYRAVRIFALRFRVDFTAERSGTSRCRRPVRLRLCPRKLRPYKSFAPDRRKRRLRTSIRWILFRRRPDRTRWRATTLHRERQSSHSWRSLAPAESGLDCTP